MRLAKPVVAALELIAAGGAVLVLSGSAFAADGSTSAPAQTGAVPATSTTQQNAEPSSTDEAQPGATSQQSSNPSSVKPGDDSQPAAGQSGEVKAEQQTKTAPSSAGQTQQPATGATATAGKGAGSGNTTQPNIQSQTQTQTTTKPGFVSITSVLTTDKVTAAPASQPVGQDQPKLPTGGQMAQAQLPVVVFKTSILPIQPTITSRSISVISDLAASVPTPPKPDKAPAPAKSSGALGKLTAVLAGVVVPPSFSLPSLVPARVALELLISLVLLVLIAVFVFSYGLWLRRGGFATAARSDSPVAAARLYLLHHSIWAMFGRRRAKDVAQILVSELAGAYHMHPA